MDAITLTYLLTIPGATAVVLLITQVLKRFIPQSFPTEGLVLILSVLIVVGAGFLAGSFTAVSIILSVVNAFVVCLAAMGSYEKTFRASDDAKKLNGG